VVGDAVLVVGQEVVVHLASEGGGFVFKGKDMQ
jgi:hypothetical protein